MTYSLLMLVEDARGHHTSLGPTSVLQSPSHPNSLAAYTHATKTTIHVSQSPQQPHPQHTTTISQTDQGLPQDYHRTTNTTQAHRPSSKSERNLIILQFNINGLKTNSRSSNYLFTTHMQISSQFMKPSSPLRSNTQST